MTDFQTFQLVSMIVGVMLPILVGLVTSRVTNPGVKATLLALLSAVSGLGSEWLSRGDDFDLGVAAIYWIQTFIVAVAMHFGLWKPLEVSQAAQESMVLTVFDRKEAKQSRIGRLR